MPNSFFTFSKITLLIMGIFFNLSTQAQEVYKKQDLRGKFKIQTEVRKEAYSNREPTESRVVSRDYLRVEVRFKRFNRISFHETNSYTNLDLKYNGTWKLKDGKIILQYERLEEKVQVELEIESENLYKQIKGGKQYLRVPKN